MKEEIFAIQRSFEPKKTLMTLSSESDLSEEHVAEPWNSLPSLAESIRGLSEDQKSNNLLYSVQPYGTAILHRLHLS